MAASNERLVRDWIQFLKNTQIVELKSDPKTGNLSYKREPTVSDLEKFLEVKTDYSREEIEAAITANFSNAVPDTDAISHDPDSIDDINYKETPRSDRQQQSTAGQRKQQQVAHDPDSISDIDYRETPRPPQGRIGKNNTSQLGHDPNTPSDVESRPARNDNNQPQQNDPLQIGRRKPRFKLRTKGNVNEALNYSQKVAEKDVANIFTLLTNPKPVAKEQPADKKPAEVPVDKNVELNKVRRIIRDVMTDSQRKALWRILTNA